MLYKSKINCTPCISSNLKKLIIFKNTSLANSFLKKFKTDYIVILAWNFSNYIINNNKINLGKNIKFFLPFPKMKVMNI